MVYFRYGWHFPELGKILTDNIAFIKTIKLVGMRENFNETDLSDILPQELEEKVKEAAEVSMGMSQVILMKFWCFYRLLTYRN